jgi:pimeloyl-ACP methyl ester carboxylesterase
MPIIQTRDGVALHCDIRGSGAANLIFLHGWGGDGSTWAEVVAHLDAALCRSFCLDLRGHGKSGLPVAGYTIQDFSEDVLTVADSQNAKTFIPVGFSMGGKLACYLAAKYPDRVAGLVLIAPAPPGLAPVDRDVGLQACRDAGDWRKNEAAFKNWFASSASSEIVKTYCQTIARTPLPVLEATAELFLWTSLVEEIGRLNLPTLLVTGKVDPVYGMAYQEREMLPFLNRATVKMLPSGHFAPLEQPEELANLICPFCHRRMNFAESPTSDHGLPNEDNVSGPE